MPLNATDGAIDVALFPNPPASRRCFGVAFALLGFACASGGVAFALAGAWPVSGFLGLDLVLLALAFRHSRRRAARWERVTLEGGDLVIARHEANGLARVDRLVAYWTYVRLARRAGGPAELQLRSRGRALSIGDFLTEAERVEFASWLKSALDALRGR